MLITWQLSPTHMQQQKLKLKINKAYLTVEGHRLDNLPVPAMPWLPCTNLFFFAGLQIIAKLPNSSLITLFVITFLQEISCGHG